MAKITVQNTNVTVISVNENDYEGVSKFKKIDAPSILFNPFIKMSLDFNPLPATPYSP